MTSAKKIQVPVVSSTHYDREWRFSFQQSRMMLADLIDNLLSILENQPEYRCYHLDGQGVILEDYLRLRPHRCEDIRRLMKEGRILAGPWYSLPDMNLIAGECIVRNLLTGHRVVSQFGPPMKVGYTATGFGQVSQLPQIYSGFGIDTALFYRGPDRTKLEKEFVWQSEDGSEVVAYLFTPEFGRMPLYHCVVRKALYDRVFYERAADWEAEEGPYRLDDPRTRWNLYYQSTIKEGFHRENIASETKRMIDTELSRSNLDTFLALDGTDSTEPEPMIPKILEAMNASCDTHEFVHTTLLEFANILREAKGKLKTHRGEMRSSAKEGVQVNLFGDTLSTRTDLKQRNAEAERKLIGWAEPFASFAWLEGADYPSILLDEAWKTLLNNQSHDCIAGCGQDIVHDDMVYHYRQVSEAADEATRRALFHLTSNLDTSRFDAKDLLLAVFNPRPHPRSELVETRVDIPSPWEARSFRIEDLEGREVPYETVQMKSGEKVLIHRPKDAPGRYEIDSWWVRFAATDVPACGWTVFKLVPTGDDKSDSIRSEDSPDDRSIENELFHLEVNGSGRFDLTDKRTGRTFKDLCTYEDRGEIGDAYFSIPVPGDDPIQGPEGCHNVSVERGPLSSSLKVEFDFTIPAESSEEGRSEDRIDIPITTTATLKGGTPWIEIKTELDNRARDHRLRVLFPTGIQADQSVSDMPFDLIERPTAPRDTEGWFERGYTNYPMRNFCAVAGEDAGFAIAGRGLPEYEAYNDNDRTLAITLLRTTRVKTPKIKVEDPDQEGTQQLGSQVFEYALMPFSGWPELGTIHRASLDYTLPMRVAQFGKQNAGSLPLHHSEIEVSAPFELSAIKPSERGDTLIVRIWNTSSSEANGMLQAGFDIESALLVSLEEERLEEISIESQSSIFFIAKPRQILTLELSPSRRVLS